MISEELIQTAAFCALLAILGLALWSLVAIGSAGRPAEWWGMMLSASVPVVLCLYVLLQGALDLDSYTTAGQAAFGLAAVVFGGCFVLDAPRLAALARETQALELDCAELAAWLACPPPAPDDGAREPQPATGPATP